MKPFSVVKLGGSLLASPALPGLLQVMAELAEAGHPLLVVPGGGPFADAVRGACAVQDPGDSAAHWMAILAMDQYAHLLTGLARGAVLAADPMGVRHGVTHLAILAPYAWLRAADPLPHRWEVTGDSIAAWVAGELGAARLVLLKSAAGMAGAGEEIVAEAPAERLVNADVVDAWFPRVLPPWIDCWIVSGRHPERLRELLEQGATVGTQVR